MVNPVKYSPPAPACTKQGAVKRRHAGRPPRHVAQAINEQLLDTARDLFCQQGIAGTSMDEVADRAGIAKQTIYRRYPGKAALIQAVVERDLDRLLDIPTTSSSQPLDCLRKFTLHRFQILLEGQNLQFVGFLMAEAVYQPALRDQFEIWSHRCRVPAIEMIEKAQANGEVRAGSTTEFVCLLDDLLGGGAASLRYTQPNAFNGLSPEAWFETRWHYFLTLIRAGQTA